MRKNKRIHCKFPDGSIVELLQMKACESEPQTMIETKWVNQKGVVQHMWLPKKFLNTMEEPQ